MFDGIRITNERLITASGLSVAGLLLSRTQLAKRLNEYRLKDNATPYIKNSDVAFAYIGLLCQGKSDFDYIREMDSDPDFYCKALGIHEIPSSETLRQRLDIVVGRWRPLILEENVNMLNGVHVDLTPCLENYIPLDIDVSPFDNSGTKKQGVARTYKGYDGYAPIFAYLGMEGYLINAELRKWQPLQEYGSFFESIELAKRLTDQPLLAKIRRRKRRR